MPSLRIALLCRMGNPRCSIQFPGKPGRKAVLLDLVKESSITYVEILRRMTSIPTGNLKRIQNQLCFSTVLDIAHDRSHA